MTRNKQKANCKSATGRKRSAEPSSMQNDSNNATKITQRSRSSPPTAVSSNKSSDQPIKPQFLSSKKSPRATKKLNKLPVQLVDSDNQIDSEFDNMDLQDDEFLDQNPDHVKVAVDAAEEREFAIDEESEGEEIIDDLASTQTTSEVTFNKRPNREQASNMDESDNFDHLKGNIAFQNYVKSLVAKEVLEAKGVSTPKKQGNSSANPRLIKSPSDTTLYALLLTRNVGPSNNIDNRINTLNMTNNEMITSNDISKFIEGIQQRTPVKEVEAQAGEAGEGSSQQDRRVVQASSSPRVTDQMAVEMDLNKKVNEAKDKARDFILEAEQFKAAVNVPQGNFYNLPIDRVDKLNVHDNIRDNPYYGSRVRDDDEFCHITCHIEDVTKRKIERGSTWI